MEPVGLNAYLFVSAVLFVCGIVCMAIKRNGIGVLMGVELVLNGANLNLVAFSRYTSLGLDGHVFALFVIVLAAAEAAITDQTAAVIVEAVQGEGGVHLADADWLRGLQRICAERGALLIVDEVQSVLGRFGN